VGARARSANPGKPSARLFTGGPRADRGGSWATTRFGLGTPRPPSQAAPRCHWCPRGRAIHGNLAPRKTHAVVPGHAQIVLGVPAHVSSEKSLLLRARTREHLSGCRKSSPFGRYRAADSLRTLLLRIALARSWSALFPPAQPAWSSRAETAPNEPFHFHVSRVALQNNRGASLARARGIDLSEEG
jgi:hypothetical protein